MKYVILALIILASCTKDSRLNKNKVQGWDRLASIALENEWEGWHQPDAPKMAYPYIDGASPECYTLTEKELQFKREHPKINLTCEDYDVTQQIVYMEE